ncbi:MAG: 50S ribosomal protein L18 [Sedimentisphaerales bacterium]|nr:50S ribosomal protein L18 [Sedimentisphaerales bacterium]
MRLEKKDITARRRKYRVRKKVSGTPERPRLNVYRSNKHIYAQIIDDVAGVTLASASTKNKSLKGKIKRGGNKEAAATVGEAIARAALNVGIKCVSFDRGPYKYHGRCKALAEAARKAGLAF